MVLKGTVEACIILRDNYKQDIYIFGMQLTKIINAEKVNMMPGTIFVAV